MHPVASMDHHGSPWCFFSTVSTSWPCWCDANGNSETNQVPVEAKAWIKSTGYSNFFHDSSNFCRESPRFPTLSRRMSSNLSFTEDLVSDCNQVYLWIL